MLSCPKYISVCKIACIILVFISSYTVTGQQLISTSEILNNNFLEDNKLPYSANIDFINNDIERIPLVRGYQFRTETDEFDSEQQQYSIRFSFNSRNERKAYDRVLSSSKDLYEVMQSEYIQDKIERTYQSILSSYLIHEELNLMDKEKVVLIDKRTVLSKLLQNSDDVKIKSWLSNEDDILSITLDSVELMHELNEEKVLLVGANQQVLIDYTNFITIEKIESIVSGFDINAIENSGIVASKIEEQKAIAEHDLEKAEANKWLDFAQLQYKGNDNLSFQKELSLGTSINIPYKGNNQIKKGEAALKVLERKYKKEIEINKTSSEMGELILNLKSEISKRDNLIQLVQNQKLQETYNAYLKIANVSPLILLDLQKSILKYKFKLLVTKKKIFQLYLEVVSKGSYFVKQPRKNYLSNTLDEY